MEEIWKIIPGFDSYLASSLGRIGSLKKNYKNIRILSGTSDKNGYLKAMLTMPDGSYKNIAFHRLVGLAFHGISDLPQINHIDGNKLNNCPDNLEWCDSSHNQRHRYTSLGHVTHNRSFNKDQVFEILSANEPHLSKNLASKFKVTVAGIKNVRLGNNYKEWYNEYVSLHGKPTFTRSFPRPNQRKNTPLSN